MKYQCYFVFFSLSILISCNSSEIPKALGNDYKQILILENNTTPTVDIKGYVLITNNPIKDSAESKEVLKVKRNFPLAMQKRDSLLFEQILSANFTFRADDEFFNRQDYILNRIHGTWTIDTVRFENLALQFFGNVAILTYKNSLKGTDDNGRPDLEKYTWADVYGKENGVWKILSVHCIDSKTEYINNQ